MIYRFQRTLSYRLLAWSLLSLLLAIFLWQHSTSGDALASGIALQFALWGCIDALIAFFGLRGLAAKIRRVPDPTQSEKDSAWLRRLLWLNTGLDVLYIAGGLALILTLGQSNPFARGNGLGVLVQGGFLFLFDLLHALSIPREATLPHLSQFDVPEHLPFDFPGHRGTVVLVHGFPGTPVEMRDLGLALNRQGWRAVGLLLPGYGRELQGLFQQRAAAWVDAITRAVTEARAQTAGPVILAGFSMGGGLSISAAAQSRPDALVLISPFWIDLPPLLRALAGIVSIFLPEQFNPYRFMPADRLLGSAPLHPPPGDRYPPTPELIHGLGAALRIPFVFLEQFVELSDLAIRAAPRVRCPVLIIQGRDDPIVRPETTRRLAARFTPPPEYVEIEGQHHVTIPEGEGYAGVENLLVHYAASVRPAA